MAIQDCTRPEPMHNADTTPLLQCIFLSRSKSCNILLHLHFGASSQNTIKRILYPHFSHCLSIWLGFMLESNIPTLAWTRSALYICGEGVYLRNLFLERCHSSLNSINVRHLEDARLTWMCDPRCHSSPSLLRSLSHLAQINLPLHSLTLRILTPLGSQCSRLHTCRKCKH